jgi:hypothetical protein
MLNDFDRYLGVPPSNEDPQNLFTLRCDPHLQQFDQANFVIVPKCGQFVIHFLRRVREANLYHNIKFDHDNTRFINCFMLDLRRPSAGSSIVLNYLRIGSISVNVIPQPLATMALKGGVRSANVTRRTMMSLVRMIHPTEAAQIKGKAVVTRTWIQLSLF